MFPVSAPLDRPLGAGFTMRRQRITSVTSLLDDQTQDLVQELVGIPGSSYVERSRFFGNPLPMSAHATYPNGGIGSLTESLCDLHSLRVGREPWPFVSS